MSETELKEVIFRLLKRVAPEADPQSLAPDQDIRQTLDIDSYDFLMFLIGLDEEMGVNVPEADYGKLITLDDLVRYLSAHLARKPG